ncbi:hypothetical protein [Nonomuraea sp. NPDC049607]|uniref:hypothetical protein n=1 Tax=unclassified Nonomuraea TaxID=2593643 RepID=UPI0034274D95
MRSRGDVGAAYVTAAAAPRRRPYTSREDGRRERRWCVAHAEERPHPTRISTTAIT